MTNDEPQDHPGRSRLLKILASPTVRTTAFIGLLSAFGILVGVYMSVVNRYVHVAVQVQGSEVTAPQGGAVVRLTIYRPVTFRNIRGRVRLERHDGRGWEVEDSAPISNMGWTTFRLVAGNGESLSLRAIVQVDGEEVDSVVPIQIPTRPLASWSGEGPSGLAARRGSTQAGGAGAEVPEVHRYQVRPSDSDVEIDLVVEGGIPVRLVENRWFISVRLADDRPWSHADVTVSQSHIDGSVDTVELQTDQFGLAEFRATPQDLESWSVSVESSQGAAVDPSDPQNSGPAVAEFVTALFEIVPSWDNQSLHLEPSVVSASGLVAAELSSQISADTWFLDVVADRSWLLSWERPIRQPVQPIIPPGGRWVVAQDQVTLAVIQSYAHPFQDNPQRSVRALWIRPDDMPLEEALRSILSVFQVSPRTDSEAAIAESLLDHFPVSPTDAELQRLGHYLSARLRPRFVPATVLFDNAEEQREALEVETMAFRVRAHVAVALGTIALLLWLIGRITVGVRQSRQRARQLATELADLDVDLDVDLGVGGTRGAVVWAAIALLTIASFFVLVLFMLAAM